MLKKLLSLALLAGLMLSASPSFAADSNGLCTAKEKAENKMYYTDKENQICCCERIGTSNKFTGRIVSKAQGCPVDNDHIKLSGPSYCPCEFTKS